MQSPKIKDVTTYLESLAPLSYQESYDNSGLLTGNSSEDVRGVLVTLDCTESVVDEAIALQCNLIVAHHPILFKGLKKITGSNYVERTLMKAIKNDISIYAAHTNLDNIKGGVNNKIADKLGLISRSVLRPLQQTLTKLVTFVPPTHEKILLEALYQAGAGQIGNYKNCSFRILGTGTFQAGLATHPHIGKPGQTENVEEARIEVILPSHLENSVMDALRKTHPYEEAAFYLTRLENENQETGAGLIGDLEIPMEPIAFLERLKKQMNAKVVRYTAPPMKSISKVAVCGGAGSFLLRDAIAKGADAYVSADFKYHEFFDAEGKLVIADIGHFESEQFTKELFHEVLSKRFPTFAINFSKTVTNPISYL